MQMPVAAAATSRGAKSCSRGATHQSSRLQKRPAHSQRQTAPSGMRQSGLRTPAAAACSQSNIVSCTSVARQRWRWLMSWTLSPQLLKWATQLAR